MEKQITEILREYVALTREISFLTKKQEKLKEITKSYLSKLPNASGGKRRVVVGDFILSLRPSKPTRTLNENGLLAKLSKDHANLIPIITDTKIVINEKALESVINTGVLTKEDISPFIEEKFKSPSLICERYDGEDSEENTSIDSIPEIEEEMPNIIEEVLGDLND